jgi:hypothetical protein
MVRYFLSIKIKEIIKLFLMSQHIEFAGIDVTVFIWIVVVDFVVDVLFDEGVADFQNQTRVEV